MSFISFVARLQVGNKVSIPIEIRKISSFTPGMVLKVKITPVEGLYSTEFYANLLKDYRFTVPYEVRESMKLEESMLVEVVLERAQKKG